MSADKRIRISEDMRKQLHGLKDVGESYDDVIRQLVIEHNRRELFHRMDEADDADEFVSLREAVDE